MQVRAAVVAEPPGAIEMADHAGAGVAEDIRAGTTIEALLRIGEP